MPSQNVSVEVVRIDANMSLRRLATRLFRPRGLFCDKLWTSVSVRWNGDVEPCSCAGVHMPTRNLADATFGEIWETDPYQATRSYLIENASGVGAPVAEGSAAFDVCRQCKVPLEDRHSLARLRLRGMGLALRRRRLAARGAADRRILDAKIDNYVGLMKCLRRPGPTVPFQPVLGGIDPTNRCNLSCPMCQVGTHEIEQPRGMMRLAEFEQIMEELGTGLVCLDLFRYGEPLLNPETVEMAEIASRRYHCRTEISSNLSVPLSDETVRGLAASGLRTLRVAADGATQEVYETYRRGGSLEQVVDNVRRIADARRSARSRYPRIVWQFLVFSHNEHERADARRLAKQSGADRFFSPEPYIPPGDAFAGWAPGGRGYRDRRRRRQILDARLSNGGTARAGKPFTLTTTVRNTTDEAWPADFGDEGSVRLGVKLYSEDGLVFHHELDRGRIASTVTAGEECQVPATLHAPDAPGRYRLKLDMVRENRFWYEWAEAGRSIPQWIEIDVS